MSITLMRRVRDHLQSANLLEGYRVRFYRWSDQDLRGDGQVILFCMPGTSGVGAHVIQRPDVSIQMVCDPSQVEAGDLRMLQILQYLRANFETTDVFNMWPTGSYTGPMYFENNRVRFELVVRCMTNDH